MIKQLEIIISGRVQGIGYRAFAMRTAESCNIRGSVRNLADGRVKILAIGEEESMERFISLLKKGPTFSLVRDLTINELDTTEDYKEFRIEY